MDRCNLKGETGDKLHAVLCAADYNIILLLRMIAKKWVTFLNKLYLRLQTLRCLTSLNVLSGPKPNLNRLALKMNKSGPTIYSHPFKRQLPALKQN